ncbi:MAG: trigger factor [Vulcanimicrobiaceae bacterium]
MVRQAAETPPFEENAAISTSTLTKLAPTKVELEISIAPEEIEAARERAFRKLVKKAKLPGFRPGKVPRGIFEQAYGSETIASQAMDDVVPEAYARAVLEHGLEPVDRPALELLPVEPDRPARVKAVVDVRPEIDLGQYKGLALQSEPHIVEDGDVERSLQTLARERATLVPVDRAAAMGDVVTMDYEGTIDGVAFEGGAANGQMTELREDRFVPGFVAGIVGMQAGEHRDVEATFPAGYPQAELAGKAAIFSVRVHEIKEFELPVIDDEFAKAVSGNQTLDALKADVRTRLEAIAQSRSRRELADQAIGQLLESHDFPLPEILVLREIESMLGDLRSRASRAAVPFEEYLASIGKSEDDLRAEYRPDAERNVKSMLLLEKIAKTERIEATPAEIAAELQALAEQYGQPVERVRAALGNSLPSLRDGIVRNKTVEYLLENASAEEATTATAS